MTQLTTAIQNQFDAMSKTYKLFRASISGSDLWDIYLKSFVQESKFRDPNTSVHNCNHCKNFIRRYGNIVAVDKNQQLVTMFDITTDEEYTPVVNAFSLAIKNSTISEVFFETYEELNKMNYEKSNKNNPLFRLGVAKNFKHYTQEEVDKFGAVNTTDIYTFNHLHLNIPTQFVDQSKKSIEAIMGFYRDAKNVFKRAMEEISLDTLYLVKDLINQGSLLDGQTHLYKIEQIIPLKIQYDSLAQNQKDNWCWINSYNLSFAKFKNELIGVLCSELAEGEEINKACQSWNKRVDPANYMKAIAPITQNQIKEAQAFVEDNGYTESFDRRFATIDDIKVSEILHSNVGENKIKTVSMFDNVKSTATRHKRNEFEGIEEVSIDKFMTDILPTCTSVEAFLINSQEGNLVSLTTANVANSKQIFKWLNNYSWTFKGNLAGKSQIKQEVKNAGGKVDGVLRFSIMWADGNTDRSDLDAHCIEPSGNIINYTNRVNSNTGSNLDVDVIHPDGKLAVENITYQSLSKMENGTYKFLINQYNNRGSIGYSAEIEFDGEIYSYSSDKSVNGNVEIAEVVLKDGSFTIKHLQTESKNNKTLYGLETNQFHKVNLVSLSPNHWDGNKVGNKYYLFILEKCKADSNIRSFHNENLLPELAEHRKVLEVLGTANMITPTDKQLSGLGYNATVRDELVVKLQGSHKRTLKIKF